MTLSIKNHKQEVLKFQIKGKQIANILRELTVWSYAIFGVREVMLAFDSMTFFPTFFLLNQLIGYLCIPLGLIVLVNDQKSEIKNNDYSLFLIPLTYWLFCVFNTYGGWRIGSGIVTLVRISIFLFLDKEIKSDIFEKFYKTILVLNIISIIIWICYQLRLPIGFKTVNYYVGDHAEYKKWFIFAIYHEKRASSIITDRLCGVFNEPGGLGTICALLFIATFKYSKKWEKLLLLTTGMLTYSVAFVVLVAGFLMAYFAITNIRYAFIAVVIGLCFLLVPYIDFKNEALNMMAARLKITSTGLAGDNRIDPKFKICYEAMKETDQIFLGYGNKFSFHGNTSSYVKFIVWFGYFGFSIMALQWIIAALRRVKTKAQLIFILFFFISLYQRPLPIINILGYILVFGGLAWMNKKQEELDISEVNSNMLRIE